MTAAIFVALAEVLSVNFTSARKGVTSNPGKDASSVE